ncbi:MAG TPA: M14 family zinc carboxypeptidase [Candidatus Thermoplasmatota archaeon]|nr:M14 family zinc carboxypeptidase [Candidatus Thermoplasmatota archaeon]
MRALFFGLILVAATFGAHPAAALPTPGLFCDTSDAMQGRVFPEAMQSNDFVGYDEARCGLDLLLQENPTRMKLDVVGQSVGWDVATGGHDTFDVFVVRVSNYESALPTSDKIRIVFQLSIHGNEKGGREGGLRVIEDLVRNTGYVADHPEMNDYLDYMELLFVFPNPDGWIHEEAQYRTNDACYTSLTPSCKPGTPGLETQNFVRVNGNGKDVNRQWPTIGWSQERYEPMSQPEAIGLVAYLKNETHVKYASDIHGMLNPADGGVNPFCGGLFGVPPDPSGLDPTCFQNAASDSKGHYVLTMLPAGRQDQREMMANTQLAELVKERLNGDAFFAEWQSLPNSAGGAWGGEFNDWGTVWDTIGYTDSGFTSDWYAQDHGLNAAGVDFELSYNHITFDNYYPGLAARMNAYHVEIVREIVRAFMDAANQDIQTSVDVKATKTAFLDNPTLVTNAGQMKAVGWAAENPLDDVWDTGGRVFRAAPNDYLADLTPYAKAGDAPGLVDAVKPGDVKGKLTTYSNLVIAGSAYRSIENDTAAKATIKSWVEKGGNLVLTDEALKMLPDLGLASEGSVDVYMGYAGSTNFVDREHALAQGIRGLARETYEPVPLGFGIDTLSSPNWYVDAADFTGEVVGVVGEGQGAAPNADWVNYGTATVGSGKVSFLGALLPDPVPGEFVFYGLDSYSTTYTGNQLLRNMLGWDIVFAQTPVVTDELAGRTAAEEQAKAAGTSDTSAPGKVPGPGLALVLVAVAAIAIARRRA